MVPFGDTLHSCCKWGRANGWGLMSHVEVLSALEATPDHDSFSQVYLLKHCANLGIRGWLYSPSPWDTTHPRPQVQSDFEHSIDSMIRFQDPSGLWHQVVNDSSTFLETSVTAMMTASLGHGLQAGWLKNTSIRWSALLKGWSGIKSRVTANGTVIGVCMGTGIEPNASGYNARGTDFYQSSPGGVGAVLKAAASMYNLGY